MNTFEKRVGTCPSKKFQWRDLTSESLIYKENRQTLEIDHKAVRSTAVDKKLKFACMIISLLGSFRRKPQKRADKVAFVRDPVIYRQSEKSM